MIRCLGKDKLFPAENPVFCDDKNDDPFYEIQCCRTDLCNKYIHISIPGKGEDSIQQQKKKQKFINKPQTTHHLPTIFINTFIRTSIVNCCQTFTPKIILSI